MIPQKTDNRLIVVCLFVLILSLCGNYAVFVAWRQDRIHRAEHPTLPIKLAKTIYKVVPPSAALSLYDDDAWSSLFTHRPGFVHLDGNNYAIAMFHQFHCLNSIRTIYLSLHNHTATPVDDNHYNHCLTYIHQILMCNADTALEPSERTLFSDGTYTQTSMYEGVNHECHDWHSLMDFAKQNYLDYKDTELAGDYTENGFVSHDRLDLI